MFKCTIKQMWLFFFSLFFLPFSYTIFECTVKQMWLFFKQLVFIMKMKTVIWLLFSLTLWWKHFETFTFAPFSFRNVYLADLLKQITFTWIFFLFHQMKQLYMLLKKKKFVKVKVLLKVLFCKSIIKVISI